MLRLLVVALSAAIVLLIAPGARASVPMCGEHAESIAAPPIIWPSKNLVLDRVAPCPGEESLVGQAPPETPRPSSVTSDSAPLRAWPASHDVPSAPRGLGIPIEFDVPALASGFAASVYRPPRLAA